MTAIEFITELNGSGTLAIPADIAAKMPTTGRARVLILTEDDSDDADWRIGGYAQFLRDDSPEDAVYDSLK